ncbi:MAG: aspartate-semialdehyde dehydrogenase [Actinomycetota bacterium]
MLESALPSLPDHPRVAVVGATGLVGRVMLEILTERAFPASEVRAVASPRSVGRRLPFGGDTLVVRALEEEVFEGIDLVLLDTPDEVARDWAPVAVRAGAVVVDNSAAWRMREEVPLVVPEVNPQVLSAHRGIIASPNCTTIGVVLPLAGLHLRFGLERVVVASYQSVSGTGRAGIEELTDQVDKLTGSLDSLAGPEAIRIAPVGSAFPATVAFNVIPLAGSLRDGGYTSEELKLVRETRKILGLPRLEVTATCVRVPTLVGHGAAVHARFSRSVEVDEALETLEQTPGVVLSELPTPLLATGGDASHVGRVRRDATDPHALWFFSACDNLRKGAALNAVQIMEHLLP